MKHLKIHNMLYKSQFQMCHAEEKEIKSYHCYLRRPINKIFVYIILYIQYPYKYSHKINILEKS